MKPCAFAPILVFGLLSATHAQAQTARAPLAGTWKAETPDGPRTVVIRADSSASYGDETVRWRMAGDSLHIAFGDEWMVYGYALKGRRLTLSGGDLEEPITLRRTGPPSARPDSIPLPPAPPAGQRGGGTVVPAKGTVPGRIGR